MTYASFDLGAASHEVDLNKHALSELTRREFVHSVAVAGIAVGVATGSWAAETKTGDMIYRTLGRTGEKISAIGLGGFHIGVPSDEQEGVRIIRSAVDRGITFMDNC